MKDSDPILDWHINSTLPEAMEALAEARVAELITPASVEPIYRQLDINCPAWQVWDAAPPGTSWTLMDDDYLYHPNLGTLIPAAVAWLGTEKIVVYKYRIVCIMQPNGDFTVGRIR